MKKNKKPSVKEILNMTDQERFNILTKECGEVGREKFFFQIEDFKESKKVNPILQLILLTVETKKYNGNYVIHYMCYNEETYGVKLFGYIEIDKDDKAKYYLDRYFIQ
jgi:hypothetical protein